MLIDMFDRINKEIKDTGVVSLSKQCKQEFIAYTFYMDEQRSNIIRMKKEHFENRDLDNPSKYNWKKVNIPINKFLKENMYDLISRGYKLEDWSD